MCSRNQVRFAWQLPCLGEEPTCHWNHEDEAGRKDKAKVRRHLPMAPQSYSGLSSNPPPGLPDTHSGPSTLLPPQPPLNSQESNSSHVCWHQLVCQVVSEAGRSGPGSYVIGHTGCSRTAMDSFLSHFTCKGLVKAAEWGFNLAGQRERGRRDHTVGKTLVLHLGNPDSIPGNLHGPLSTSRSNS